MTLPALTTTETALLALVLVLGVPLLVWRLLGRRRGAPLVVIQILTGIVLGPGLFGAAAPDLHAALFPPAVIAILNGIALWAVILFVWLAGLELDPAEAWAARAETGVTAALALVVPLTTGAAAAVLLTATPGWVAEGAARWQAVLGIGMACAVTALPILVLFLDQLGLLRRPLGQRVLRYASLDDIIVWAVLAAILLDAERILRQGVFLAAFAVASVVMRRVLPRVPEAERLPLALVWVAAAALLSDWAGLHYMVGAFLAGVVLDARLFGAGAVDRLRQAVLWLLMPVFFLSTGLRTDWDLGGLAVLGAALLLLVAAVGGKLAGTMLAGRILGWPKGEGVLVGWLLQTKALIMIIFANVLLDRDVITPATFTALLLMAVGSTMLTMPMVARRLSPDDRAPS